MAAKTIDEVIARLEGIIEECISTRSRLGYFAALYNRVTEAVKKLKLLHRRQIVSYLRSLGLRAGLLLNFDRPYLREGIRRIVL